MRRKLRAFHMKQETTMDIGLVALAVCCICCAVGVALSIRSAPRHEHIDGYWAAYHQGREDERRARQKRTRS